MRTLEIRKDMRAEVFSSALCFLGRVIYPPTQKTTPTCRNACLPTGRHFEVQARALPVDAVGHSLWRRTMDA